MDGPQPPAYAWDWFARQRMLWRGTHERLLNAPEPLGTRYAEVETRSDVVTLLRADYPRNPRVRDTVRSVVAELAFAGRLDRTFSELGVTNAPRGMRWWWTSLTGDDSEPPVPGGQAAAGAQLTLDQILEGYGDR